MQYQSPRQIILLTHFPDTPRFRLQQLEEGLFSPAFAQLADFSVWPKIWREKLETESFPWMSFSQVQIFSSKQKDTYKALLTTGDNKKIETVLMQNARGHWSVCVSSQIGCAMACKFCATGTMGLTRNLTVDEIVDQVRIWQQFLWQHRELDQEITNVVYMGMGEPLANYANVKESLRLLLTYTKMGPTRITVSTVGLVPMLNYILSDPEWPSVRLAVSLHSADSMTRKTMMPSSYDGFLDKLYEWTREYFAKHASRRRHVTFEYVMLSKVNDTKQHAEALIKFARKVGKVKINLIPYNFTGEVYKESLPGDFQTFEKALREAGVDVTRRRTMGDDIAAACGQLVVEKTDESKL